MGPFRNVQRMLGMHGGQQQPGPPSRQATPPRKPALPSAPLAPTGRTALTARTTMGPEPGEGTTRQEAAMARQLGATIQETHTRTGQALSLLHTLAAPPPGEAPSQITEILSALTAVLESQRRMEQQQEAPAADARQAVARRAAEARLAHGLAGLPNGITRLRQALQELDPTWRDARDARMRIRADQARIEVILSTHPHPDPASRDPAARANAYAHAISEHTRQRTAEVDAAQAQATAAVQGRSRTTRLLAFVGIATAEQRQAESLVAHAVALADASDLLPSRDDYTRARADGEAHAYAAQQTTAAWEQRPEVAAAMEQHRLNQAVHEAVAAGNQAITAALDAGDPEAARAIIRVREHEEERRRVEQERLEQLRRGMDDHGGTRPPPGRK